MDPENVVYVGEVPLNKQQTNELISLFDHPGWKLFSIILEKNKQAQTEVLLGGAPQQKTLQDLGFSQGVWNVTQGIQDMPEVVREDYKSAFSQK